MAHPISGPISPEELQAIAELPYGQAAVELRKHDPAWGKAPRDGGKIRWTVFCTQRVIMEAEVMVEAETEEEAMDLVADMREGDLNWDYNSSEDFEVESAEPE